MGASDVGCGEAVHDGRVYVNYIGAGEAPDRVRAAFSPEKFARLVHGQAAVRSDERVPDESEHSAWLTAPERLQSIVDR